MDIIVAKLINDPTKNNLNSYLEDSRRENHLKLNCCCPSAYREEVRFNSFKPITLLNLTGL
jgi:hypothetical protein